MDKCKDHNNFIEALKAVDKRTTDMHDDMYGRTGEDRSIFERFRGIDLRFDHIEVMIKNLTDTPKTLVIWLDRLFKIFISGSIVIGIILKLAGKL